MSAMKIEPEDPRKCYEHRSYTRGIVPGSIPDQKKRFTGITFRPDELRFAVARTHSNGNVTPWEVVKITMNGWRVVKGGKTSRAAGQRYDDTYDMTSGEWDHPAPADVIEYIGYVVEGLNAGQES